LVNQTVYVGAPTSREQGVLTEQGEIKKIIEATYDIDTDRLRLRFSDETTEERTEDG